MSNEYYEQRVSVMYCSFYVGGWRIALSVIFQSRSLMALSWDAKQKLFLAISKVKYAMQLSRLVNKE